MTNSLVQLGLLGQSPWYDYITRDLVRSGELARLVREEGVRGMTSNPTIFEKALAGSPDYDADIRTLAARGETPAAICRSADGGRCPGRLRRLSAAVRSKRQW